MPGPIYSHDITTRIPPRRRSTDRCDRLTAFVGYSRIEEDLRRLGIILEESGSHAEAFALRAHPS
jgi:hypothetical protein